MIVKVGRFQFEAGRFPIMIILNEQEKQMIRDMAKDRHRFIAFPAGFSEPEAFILEPPVVVKSLAMLELRPLLQMFAAEMEVRLKANDHKKGLWAGREQIFEKIQEKLNEVEEEPSFSGTADVANFLAMLASWDFDLPFVGNNDAGT